MGNQNIYAAYRGDRYIGEGTVEEIAAMAGVSCSTVRWGISAVSRKRYEKQKGSQSKGMLLLVLVKAEGERARRERRMRDKPCKGCGKMMHQVDYKRQYCDECLKEHTRERYARREEQYKRLCHERKITYRDAEKLPLKGVKPYDPNESRRNSLDDIAAQAKTVGMNYGKYMAQKRMAKGCEKHG